MQISKAESVDMKRFQLLTVKDKILSNTLKNSNKFFLFSVGIFVFMGIMVGIFVIIILLMGCDKENLELKEGYILEDIQNSLMNSNWKQETLKILNHYIRGLEIATDEKIKKMVNKHCEYMKIYGKNGRKTIYLSKKIDKEIQKIYNKKFL